MNTQEWALVIFTILMQMIVGSFIVLGAVHFYAARKAGMAEADRMNDRALLSLVPLVGLALLASLFHLGNPINAPRAISNLATSWLSREILFTVGFSLLAVVFIFLQWKKIGSFTARNVLAWVAAAFSVAMVYSMSRIYMIDSHPAWNTWATPITFFTTTLLLGSLAMGVAFIANYNIEQRKAANCDAQCVLLREVLGRIAVFCIVLLGIEFIAIPLYMGTLATLGASGVKSAATMVQSYGWLFGLRLALAFLGAGVFGVFIYRTANLVGEEKSLSNWGYGAFALVLIAEVLGRFLFYATGFRIGV